MDEYKEPLEPPKELMHKHTKYGNSRPHLQEIGTNHDYVSRFLTLTDAVRHMHGPQIPRTTEQLCEMARRAFAELRGRGIVAPIISIAPMKSPGGFDAVFLSLKDIQAAKKSSAGDPEDFSKYAQAMYDMWERVFDYYRSKIDSREPFLWDIWGSHQYVWGKAKHDTENRLYLVDADPYFANGSRPLKSCLDGLAFEISLSDREFKDIPRVDLTGLGKKIREASRSMHL